MAIMVHIAPHAIGIGKSTIAATGLVASIGAIMGALYCGFTSGGTMGPLVAGFLFDINGNYYSAFLVIGSFSFLGCALAMA